MRFEFSKQISELDEKFDKAKNKVVFAALFCFVVTIFQIDSQASIFGTKFTNLNDRVLEISSWLVMVFLFANATFRFLDERREPQFFLNSVIDYKNELKQVASEFPAITLNMQNNLRELKRYDANHPVSKIFRELKQRSDIEKLDANNRELKKLQSEINRRVDRHATEIKKLLQEQLPPQVDKLIASSENFSHFANNLTIKGEFKNISGFRFLVFDVIIPVFLFLITTALVWYPPIKNIIMSMLNISGEVLS